MRKTKLGAAVLAALATMALSASAAQAFEWTAAEYPAAVSGEQSATSQFSWGFEDSTTAKCTTVGFGGELTKASTSLTLTTGGTTCTAFTFAEASVNMNECTVVLKPTAGSGDAFTGTVNFSCPEGKKIVITGGNCEVKIGAQAADRAGVSFTTVTAATPDEIEAKFSVTTLTYEKAKDGLTCPLTGTGTLNTGTLGGTVKLKAGKKEGGEGFNIGMK